MVARSRKDLDSEDCEQVIRGLNATFGHEEEHATQENDADGPEWH